MLSNYYGIIKVLHIVSLISWMAGILYLPRLYVYHTRVTVGSESDKLFQEMERKLLRIIMNPAMIATYIFGTLLVLIYGLPALGIWFHIKFTCIILLTIFHMMCARWRKSFETGTNTRSHKFYRIANEVPAILMIIIVYMVIQKPFE